MKYFRRNSFSFLCNNFKKCRILNKIKDIKMAKRKRESEIEHILTNSFKCVEKFSFQDANFSRSPEEVSVLKPRKKKQKILLTSSTENIENEISGQRTSNNFDKGSVECDIEDSKSNGVSKDVDDYLDMNEIESKAPSNYALRPRPCLRKPVYKRDFVDEDLPGNNTPSSVEVFRRRRTRGSQRLSKYRRRTANARERHRMKEINNAFKTLREVLPKPTKMKDANFTKITTLRMAVEYIQALDDLLHNTEITLECQQNSTTQTNGMVSMTNSSPPNSNNLISVSNATASTLQESIISNTLTDFLFNLTSSGSLNDSLSTMLGPSSGIGSKVLKDEVNCPYTLEDSFLGLQNVDGVESDPIALLLSSEFSESDFLK